MDTYKHPWAGRLCVYPAQKTKRRNGKKRRDRDQEDRRWRNHNWIERQSRLMRLEKLMEQEIDDE